MEAALLSMGTENWAEKIVAYYYETHSIDGVTFIESHFMFMSILGQAHGQVTALINITIVFGQEILPVFREAWRFWFTCVLWFEGVTT